MARERTVEFDDGVLMGGVEVTPHGAFAGEVLMTLGPLPPFFWGCTFLPFGTEGCGLFCWERAF